MTTQTQTPPTADDTALKAKHAAMWALGDYAAVARELIPELGHVLVDACAIGPGQRVLDVAAGTGNVAIPAAQAGAEVVACDLAPELLDIGRGLAREAGTSLDWRRADAESLPFGDGSFDVVTSCVGVMFAPHHQLAADELVRVLRPGGRLGLVAWTPAGFIGQMFATMKPYAAPPPPGAQPPPLWGDESHTRELLGGRVEDIVTEKRSLTVHFDQPEDFRDFFKRTYGPTIVTYRGIADDPAKVAALDAALTELAREHMDGSGRMGWEYLLLTARRTA
ncbi:class I SAM-dependent methyltransferase [Humibacillus xanthopallidus]|uniref:Methyltransferase family protein n=1 Tax=Humibacillus xanthopallidus TaxID=412689 RepID=A0A543HUZ8_9MICO|nr:class I SAM-dependent methyltransferase [Humibacillus xanthopallidus]TQM62173.1 methyltransferase family protein [Humibacillus xanthopallidus]